MGTSIANLWDHPYAKTLAEHIAGRGSCGPAVVVWIAAVWNILRKGRTNYDFIAAVENMKAGPRLTHADAPGFRKNLDTVLRRQTNGELWISKNTLRSAETIHKTLEKYDRPIIICLTPGWADFHYVSLYKSRIRRTEWWDWELDKIKFYWQDNGYTGRKNGGNPGLYGTSYQTLFGNFFPFANRVCSG